MNNPIRIAGLTFYQKSFTPDDRATVLQVVSNPSWLMPYISCAMMALGLVLQFSLHLAAFFGRRRRVAAAAPGPEPSLPLFQQLLPVVAVACGLGFLASKVFPPPNPSAFDTQGFGRLPVLTDGRVKPFDTLARSSLLQLQGRQRVAIDDTHSLTPDEWLLDVLFRPEKADGYATFIIDNPDVLGLIGKSDDDLAIHYPDRAHQIMAVLDVPGVPSRRRRFSYREIEPHFSAIEAQAKLADPVDSRLRNPFQRSVLQLYENLSLYRRLEHTLQEPGSADFLGELRRFQDALPAGVAAVRAKEAGQPHSEDEVRAMIELGQRYDQLAQATQVLAIPPSDAAGATAGWKTAGQGVLEAFGTGEVDPGVMAYAGLGYAWRTGQPDKFNTLVGLYGGALARQLSPELRKSNAEFRFNAAEPFYASMLLYIFAFFAAILSWLAWPRSLGRAAYWLVILAWVAATAGIAARMWIEGRPPVTNLYSSALFIGWGAVGLCLLLEGTYRNAIGTVAAGLIGLIVVWPKLVTRNDRMMKTGLGLGQIIDHVLSLQIFAEVKINTAGLGHGFDDQDPWHHLFIGKMPAEIILIDGHVLDSHQLFVGPALQDAVNHQKGITMRNDFLDIGNFKSHINSLIAVTPKLPVGRRALSSLFIKKIFC